MQSMFIKTPIVFVSFILNSVGLLLILPKPFTISNAFVAILCYLLWGSVFLRLLWIAKHIRDNNWKISWLSLALNLLDSDIRFIKPIVPRKIAEQLPIFDSEESEWENLIRCYKHSIECLSSQKNTRFHLEKWVTYVIPIGLICILTYLIIRI